MTDPFIHTIRIEDFGRLLLWLMIICLAGFCITGWLIMVMARFFLRKSSRIERSENAGKKEYEKFSILAFELPFSYTKFNDLISSITDPTKDIVRLNLKLDYLFMPFAYLLMFFSGWFILHSHHYDIHDCRLYNLLFVPFFAWLFDILENKAALTCLKENTVSKSRMLLGFSIVKWTLIIAYIVAFAIIGFQ